MSDLISREDAIKAAWKPKVTPGGEIFDALKRAIQSEIENIPSATVPGWIPCSERLPNMEERLKAYVKNHYASEFIVMIRGANRPTTLLLTHDNYWVDENRDEYDVIAWRQLPEPYKERKAEDEEVKI